MNRGRDVQGRIGSFYDDDHDYALYIKAEASKYHQFIIMLFPQEAHNWQAHNAAPYPVEQCLCGVGWNTHLPAMYCRQTMLMLAVIIVKWRKMLLTATREGMWLAPICWPSALWTDF